MATSYSAKEAPMKIRSCLLVCAAGFSIAPIARGEPSLSFSDDTPRFGAGITDIGVSAAVGAGISGYTGHVMRDTVTSNVANDWMVRAVIGTQIPLGVEVSYLGTTDDVNTASGSPNGTLLGTTFEAALHYNFRPHAALDPYVLAGVGWTHYGIHGAKVAQAMSGMPESDDVPEFPLGAGLALRDPSGFVFDVRAAFHATAGSELVTNPETGDKAPLYAWDAAATLGWEF
jgi:hypothetical protein